MLPRIERQRRTSHVARLNSHSKKISRQPYEYRNGDANYEGDFATVKHKCAHLTLKRTSGVGIAEKERDEMVF